MAPALRRVFPDAWKREAVERVETNGLVRKAVADRSGLHETALRGHSLHLRRH